ncbi:MAG TPA: DUF1707 domain-containing protein [Streptosporangiaceae bacterium]|nr:DUF1707 domain-containing protein [Streptosporangiaceae bacterium]
MEQLDRTLASDAERDAAAERLQVAFAEGRLADTEFDQRMRSALTARTWLRSPKTCRRQPRWRGRIWHRPARPGGRAGWRSPSRARSARPGAGGSPGITTR